MSPGPTCPRLSTEAPVCLKPGSRQEFDSDRSLGPRHAPNWQPYRGRPACRWGPAIRPPGQVGTWVEATAFLPGRGLRRLLCPSPVQASLRLPGRHLLSPDIPTPPVPPRPPQSTPSWALVSGPRPGPALAKARSLLRTGAGLEPTGGLGVRWPRPQHPHWTQGDDLPTTDEGAVNGVVDRVCEGLGGGGAGAWLLQPGDTAVLTLGQGSLVTDGEASSPDATSHVVQPERAPTSALPGHRVCQSHQGGAIPRGIPWTGDSSSQTLLP